MALLLGLLVMTPAQAEPAASSKMELIDLGFPAPIGRSRGGAALTGKDGEPLFAVWLTHGSPKEYPKSSLLVVNALTGESFQLVPDISMEIAFAVPFRWLVAKDGIFYTYIGQQLVRYDPKLGEKGLTSEGGGADTTGFSITEAPGGKIYIGGYPKAMVMEYDQGTRKFRDIAQLQKAKEALYVLDIAYDQEGWIYGGVGYGEAVVVGVEIATGKKKEFRYPDQQAPVSGTQPEVRRGRDGAVYARYPLKAAEWMKLSGGKLVGVVSDPAAFEEEQIGRQDDFSAIWPDGRKLVKLDLEQKRLITAAADGTKTEVPLSYQTGGAKVYSITSDKDGVLYGSSGHPLRFYRINPDTGERRHTGLSGINGHMNAIGVDGSDFFGAIYGGRGNTLVHFDLSKPYTDQLGSNPHTVARADGRNIGRPHVLFIHPNGRDVYIGGNPGYGFTGGGMLIYNRQTGESREVYATDLAPDLSVNAIALLPNGHLAIGTTIEPGNGGEVKATEAKLLIWSPEEGKVVQSLVPVPKHGEIRDLIVDSAGKLHGVTDRGAYFVYAGGKVIHQENLATRFGNPSGGKQGPRILHHAPDGKIIGFFTNDLVELTPGTYRWNLLGKLPQSIFYGTVTPQGRIFITSGARLYEVKP